MQGYLEASSWLFFSLPPFARLSLGIKVYNLILLYLPSAEYTLALCEDFMLERAYCFAEGKTNRDSPSQWHCTVLSPRTVLVNFALWRTASESLFRSVYNSPMFHLLCDSMGRQAGQLLVFPAAPGCWLSHGASGLMVFILLGKVSLRALIRMLKTGGCCFCKRYWSLPRLWSTMLCFSPYLCTSSFWRRSFTPRAHLLFSQDKSHFLFTDF